MCFLITSEFIYISRFFCLYLITDSVETDRKPLERERGDMQQMVPCQKQTLQFNDVHLNHLATRINMLVNVYVHMGTLSAVFVHVWMSLIGKSEQMCVYKMHSCTPHNIIWAKIKVEMECHQKENSIRGTACSQMPAGIKRKESGNRSQHVWTRKTVGQGLWGVAVWGEQMEKGRGLGWSAGTERESKE